MCQLRLHGAQTFDGVLNFFLNFKIFTEQINEIKLRTDVLAQIIVLPKKICLIGFNLALTQSKWVGKFMVGKHYLDFLSF